MNEKLIEEILDKHLERGLRGDIKLHEPHTYNHIRNAMIEYETKVKEISSKGLVSVSFPTDDRIVAEAIQAARKVDTEVGLLPSNNDIKMFCLGAKFIRDLVQGNDR